MARVGRLVAGFVKLGQCFLPAWPTSMAFGCGWMYHTAVAWRPPVLAGSWSESSSKSPVPDMVSTAGRSVGGAFSGLKPTSFSSLGLIGLVGDVARRVVDTHLVCIHFSFLAASNTTDILKKPIAPEK